MRPGVKIAPKKAVLAALVQKVKKIVPDPVKKEKGEKPPPPPPPPTPKFGGISRDGAADIKFDEPMKTPNVNSPNKLMRELAEGKITLSEVDVQRDIVDVDFGLRNSDNSPAYSLQIKEWTKDNFKV